MFIFVDGNESVHTSADGISWTHTNLPRPNSSYFNLEKVFPCV
jgi:hypothetical protein